MRQNAFEVALRYREGPTAGAYSAQPLQVPYLDLGQNAERNCEGRMETDREKRGT